MGPHVLLPFLYVSVCPVCSAGDLSSVALAGGVDEWQWVALVFFVTDDKHDRSSPMMSFILISGGLAVLFSFRWRNLSCAIATRVAVK